jgi:phage terminase large subunit GpA-like protein
MRASRHNVIAERAEPYLLRTAPAGVLALTAGVDTQDDRLAVHITGWGRGMAFWVLDYVELPAIPSRRCRLGRAHRAAQPPDRARQRRALRVEAVAIDASATAPRQ